MAGYPCSDDPSEVIEKIVQAKVDADKLDKFVNGGVLEEVQLGVGEPTPTIRNLVHLVKSAAAVLDGSDVSGKFSDAANGGQTLRMLADRFGDIVNVKDFGAIGDGVADDTEAFIAALATGKEVFVPDGDYVVSPGATSVNSSNVYRIHGEGYLVDSNGDLITINGKPVWLPSAARSAPKRTIDVIRYYVDGVNGNDRNDGTSSSTAWKTMDRFFQLLNEGYDDIRCYIISGGVYYVHDVDTISDCAIHITSTSACVSTPYIWFTNNSSSLVFYNSHLNLYSTSSYKLQFGICKYVSGSPDTSLVGKMHSDNSLITIRKTKLHCIQYNFYSCGAFFSDTEFERLVMYNTKFRASKNSLHTTYNSYIEDEYEETDDYTANIYAINSDLYLSAGISADARLGNTAKFLRCYNSNVYLGDHVYPTNADENLNYNYVFEFRGCNVLGPIFDTVPNTNYTYYEKSVSYAANGAYVSYGTELRGGGGNISTNSAGSDSGYRLITAGINGGMLRLEGKDYSTHKFQIMATDGTDTSTLQGNLSAYLSWDGAGIRPGTDNAAHLGTPSYRWDVVYAGTGTIDTSDAREKASVASPSEALMRAWGRVGFKVFQFKDAVAKKGAETARIHVGVIAQDVQAAFEAEGLDAFRYGLLCHDEWGDEWETEIVVDADERIDPVTGETIPAQTHEERRQVQTAGDRFGIRYEEALALECAYQRWLGEQRNAEIEALEAKVSALENRS